MEEASENGKESSHSACADGMNEWKLSGYWGYLINGPLGQQCGNVAWPILYFLEMLYRNLWLFINCWLFQAQDDRRDGALSLEDLLPNEPVHPISYDSLLILLGVYNLEITGF